MTWWHYLLLVNLYLLLFYGFYALLLCNETFFQLNRIYLVGGALLSFMIPIIQADWIKQLFITRQVQQTIYSTIDPGVIYQVNHGNSEPVTFGQIFAVIYIAGAIFLLGRFFMQLLAVKKLIARVESSTAFSFFNKVKIDAGLPGQQTIIEHEQVHVSQWHSADVLFIEAVMIVNWFNPVVYFYRKAIKHVHEYIADKKAIEKGTSKTEYAYLLLSQTFGAVPHQLTNNFFNHSLLKQRIIMLNKDESKRRVLLKYGLSAPLFAAMLILSSATVKNSRMIRIINKKTEQVFLMHPMRDKVPASTLVLTQENQPSQDNKAEVKADVTTVTDSITAAPDNTDPSPVLATAEAPPEFPGGAPAFGRFLQLNIRYPQSAKEHDIEGKAFVQFIVEKDGSLTDLKVLRDPGEGLGEEAIRVLATSPKWVPGIQNGNPVKVQYMVPVDFELHPDNQPRLQRDTFKKIINIITQIPGSGTQVHRDTLLANKRPAVQSVVYFKRGTTDSVKAVYIVNDKELTPEEVSRINPREIKEIRVLKNYDKILSDDKTKTSRVEIILKAEKPE